MAKCPYCDFNSHVASNVNQTDWADAYEREIVAWAQHLPEKVLGSIYLGGGTPSLMRPETVARVIDVARSAWRCVNDIEITLEANPTSVERGKFQAFAAAGVNRVSLGIQALDDTSLKLLGRQHSAQDALVAWGVAQSIFPRQSFDLIYARQFQSLADWREELGRAISFQPGHLSLYQLTIEDGTRFGDRYKLGKLPGLPGEDLGADMYFATQEICESAGLSAYEVSNHARPGQESRHNLTYWRYGDYVGIGPGAHGRVTKGGMRVATAATRSPTLWLEESRNGVDRLAGAETLSLDEVRVEFLLMGMRLSEGADLARLARIGAAGPDNNVIDALCADGLLWRSGTRIGTTSKGRPLLNALLRDLL
jgi:oxygen-independent coproporphyrinogen-3 oxidase